MEVLINVDNKQNSAWYQFRPSTEAKTFIIEPKKVKTNKEKKTKSKRFQRIYPRISVNMVKSKAYTGLGTAIGASMGYFRIN